MVTKGVRTMHWREYLYTLCSIWGMNSRLDTQFIVVIMGISTVHPYRSSFWFWLWLWSNCKKARSLLLWNIHQNPLPDSVSLLITPLVHRSNYWSSNTRVHLINISWKASTTCQENIVPFMAKILCHLGPKKWLSVSHKPCPPSSIEFSPKLNSLLTMILLNFHHVPATPFLSIMRAQFREIRSLTQIHDLVSREFWYNH